MRRIFTLTVLCAAAVGCGQATSDVFYGTVGNPTGGKLVSIEVNSGNKVTITPIGEMGAFGCNALARSSDGTLYTVCGLGLFKPDQPQQLATVDPKTGRATTFGKGVTGLAVMSLEFAPDGTLYAVGDGNPASPTFNSLYTVDVKSGEFAPVGPTGVPAPDFFMDFAFDSSGTMYGATSRGLFTIDRKSGTATKVTDFVGGGDIMGLAYNADHNKLYATEYRPSNSAMYTVDTKTGFLTPVAAMGFPLAHGLVPSK
jgi:DNA-binding beta-propeller fold protein YncE